MEEYKLYFKWPKWLFISLVVGYSIWGIFDLLYILFLLKNIKDLALSEKILSFISIFISLSIEILAWYVIVASAFQGKYYYIINKDGIYNNQVNLLKKYLPWENELYYCITDSYIGLYKSKMLPLDGEIINNLALKGEVCCSPEVLHSGFNTFLTALKGGVLNPSARINEKNITDGYISIKSKKALKKYYDNKGWIAISTKLLKNNIQIHDIVAMINKSRENNL